MRREYKYYLEKKFHWENKDNPQVGVRRKDILNRANVSISYQFMEVQADKVVLECKAPMYLEPEFQVSYKVNAIDPVGDQPDFFFPEFLQNRREHPHKNSFSCGVIFFQQGTKPLRSNTGPW